jgi:hypothetical protein
MTSLEMLLAAVAPDKLLPGASAVGTTIVSH